MYRQTKVKPSSLAAIPEPPKELMYLWIWLRDQNSPMSFTELEAWARLTGKKLAMWEVEALIKLDRVRSNDR